MAKPDWAVIEADFLATGMSYSDLARKWGVPISTVKKRAMRGKWGEKHEEVVSQLEPETKEMEPVPISPEEMALELRAQRSRRMMETTDAMMDRIIDALELIDRDNTYALMTLVKALKELREMQGLNKSALDIEEQRLRIEKLKSEIRGPENTAGGGVIVLPEVNGELVPPDE